VDRSKRKSFEKSGVDHFSRLDRCRSKLTIPFDLFDPFSISIPRFSLFSISVTRTSMCSKNSYIAVLRSVCFGCQKRSIFRETFEYSFVIRKLNWQKSGNSLLKITRSVRVKLPRMKQLALYHWSSRICHLTLTRATAIQHPPFKWARNSLWVWNRTRRSGPVSIHLPRKFCLNGSRPQSSAEPAGSKVWRAIPRDI